MKCFKYILIILIFMSFGFAAEYEMKPIDSKEYTTGDILVLKVESLEFDKALRFTNSRISNLLYVLNAFKKNEEVYFEAILSEDNNFVAKEDTFKVDGLNYRPVKLNLEKGIDVVDSKIVLIKDNAIIIIAALIFLILLVLIVRLYLKKLKNKRARVLQKTKLNINNSEITRDHLEFFYRFRKDFKSLYTYSIVAYEDFESSLNSIQYKKYWSKEEYEKVVISYKALVVTSKEKNGI